MSTEQRPSALAVFAAAAAGAGATLAGAGPLGANLALVQPLTGFTTFLSGALLAFAGLVLGGFGLRATRDGRPGRRRAWFAVTAGAVVLAALLAGALPGRGAPRINDVTTSPDDPPTFEAAAGEEANRGRSLAYRTEFAAVQRKAYPDLAPLPLPLPPAEAFERAHATARALGWEVTLVDPARGILEARARSRVFRFVDDVAIRVRPADGGSVVDVRSRSRDGPGDLGANAARIRAFAVALAG